MHMTRERQATGATIPIRSQTTPSYEPGPAGSSEAARAPEGGGSGAALGR